MTKRDRKAQKVALAIAYKIWRGVRVKGFHPKIKHRLPKRVRYYLKHILKANRIKLPK